MPPQPRLPALAAICGLLAACSGTPSTDPATSASPTSSVPSASTPAPTTAPTTSPSSPSPTPTATIPDPEATPASATELADRLVAAERAVRDPGTRDDALESWAHVQHAAYRTLATTPGWRETVLAEVPAELQDAVQANLRAQEQLFALTEPRTELPDWRIVPPPPADELRRYYQAAAEEFGIDWTYLAAIHLVETRMGRIRGLSSAGAQGPMQFIPATWAAYGEGDVNDPQDAIRAAARYLADHGAPGDIRDALWAYNHSDRYVDAVSAYAGVMQADPTTYDAYHQWRVHYRLQSGDVVLEEGWTK